jgi:hypothetical protein
MDLLERSAPLATERRHGFGLVPLHDGLTRVLRRDGAVAGYVELVPDPADPAGTRYRAKRMRPRAAGFAVVGEFWSADDALDALRFG